MTLLCSPGSQRSPPAQRKDESASKVHAEKKNTPFFSDTLPKAPCARGQLQMLCSLNKTVLNTLKGLFILTSSKEGTRYDKGPKS